MHRIAIIWGLALGLLLMAPARVHANASPGHSGYWRLDTRRGPVHVWLPPGYDPATAGIVVYVHGYFIDADGAWTGHALAAQFRASRRNAVFIVPEAPSGPHGSRTWRRLGDLLDTVFAGTELTRPEGELVVMGHSGAYRTVLSWLDNPDLDTVISLDTMYGVDGYFAAWLAKTRIARLIDVAVETQAWSEDLAEQVSDAVVVDTVPASLDELPDRVYEASLVYMRGQYEHMELVTSGEVIPRVLAFTELESIELRAATAPCMQWRRSAFQSQVRRWFAPRWPAWPNCRDRVTPARAPTLTSGSPDSVSMA